MRMRTTVVVPTFRRTAKLTRCLAAIRAQTMAPSEVLVTVRDTDTASRNVVGAHTDWPALREVPVSRAGVVAAMNAALDATTGDIVALTDDDAEPAPDWLERMAHVLEAHADVAGVGGKDIQSGVSAERADVGRVQWFGRVIGNHHIGVGPARDVDVLKGVCCAFRTEAIRTIRFDERLRGQGAQVHWELALCLALRRAGWRLVYDPAIQVTHHVAPRHDADQLHRGRFDSAPHEDAVFNETLAMREHLRGLRRLAFESWSLLVGTAESPGIAQLPRVVLSEGSQGWQRFLATRRARRG